MTGNKKAIEIHGCIVCGRLLNVLAVYAPNGKLVGCTVTNPGGHYVPDENQLLAACNIHTAEVIESAHKRWQSRNEKELDDEQEDD